jgi:glycosyltransferase involved in cell wall biosynthesis
LKGYYNMARKTKNKQITNNNNKEITVGIPAYKASGHIEQCLASVYIQTIVEKIAVIIAADSPDDDYQYLKQLYPTLDITILPCTENTGPGLARQRCLDACNTEWITFIDADDVFYSPFSIETLKSGTIENVIEVQGTFLQEITGVPEVRAMPMNNAGLPWVFGKLYNVPFLRQHEIGFTSLRAMEDGELNWKINLTVEGSQWQIAFLDDPVYLWRTGSEHSITRIGADEEDGIPQYNFDLCQWGATEAAIGAIKFCKKKNPFNGNIIKFTVERMIDHYFTYIECVEKKPIFAEQNFFNAKKFYHECFAKVEGDIDEKILKEMYTVIRMNNGENLINVIPCITFNDFMEKIKNEEYGGDDEFKQIRSRLPQYIIDNDIKTGVATF